ncbi:polysaccharide biosynthesis/export family protein [Tunturibacter empetritectus]|uniref:Polysaccharide export outer membrane protein n=1 Tax=Tunturiibacter empetritectus TaxID=3069691 RepID=A0A7W8IEL6_9BACT|nr:polysaccharide biosynthesis/export family protein [Edaphobacter lichenicola]MBB5315502.1 polysaccharide export outer membrane protein [Edaphobacter lichenicola]
MNQIDCRKVWLASAVFLLMALCGRFAEAQFSGPALGITAEVNPPITITTDPAILFPAGRDAYLGIGDVLSIRIYGNQDYTPVARIGVDGTVQLPLIGSVMVNDLTVHQAQNLIAQKLISAGMYRDPQVSIQISESPNQVVTLMGEVKGIVPVVGQRRLFDVLAAAGGGGGTGGGATTVVGGGGGLPSTASHVLTINRYGAAEPIVIDLGTDPAKSALINIPIFPRDTIIVPRVGVVYLLGAFKVQGAIPLQQNSPITLMKVAALAGGPGFEGKYSDLRIIRTTGTTRQVVRVDIMKVINGKVPDPVLQAEDIVFMPTSPMKAVIKNGGIATLLGIISILIVAVQQ